MTAHDAWIAPSPALVVGVLEAARDLVFDGWCQGQAHVIVDGHDCYCPMGALSEVCGSVRLSFASANEIGEWTRGEIVPGTWIRDAATAALLQVVPRPFVTVPAYNDFRGRTQADAINLFTRAIQMVRRDAA